MIALCHCTEGPYKEREKYNLPAGSPITYGYRAKWVSPAVISAILGNLVHEGEQVVLAAKTLGVPGPSSDPRPSRIAEVFRAMVYPCPDCGIPAYVRFDLMLTDNEVPSLYVGSGESLENLLAFHVYPYP